jgi:hypothetical protein
VAQELSLLALSAPRPLSAKGAVRTGGGYAPASPWPGA